MGTGVGEAMLLQSLATGAVVGAGTSALTGQDPLKGAMFGALGGAIMPGIGQALGGAPTAAAAEGAALSSATAANTAATAAQQNALTQGLSQTAADNAFRQTFMDQVVPATSMQTAPQTGFTDIFKSTPGGPDFGQRVGNFIVQNPGQAAMTGSGLANTLLNRPESFVPEPEKYKGPLSMFEYDPRYYRPAYAAGGIADIPVSRRYAGGGDLGGYSDGGRMLKGPGDGMSDSIPARIGARQPARLADGEFVVPADVVSHLGNGSTDAGAKQLYSMMDKVRKARTGTKKQGKEINPRKYVPA